MKLTFIDSGVLIQAIRGQGALTARAMEILDDPERSFASSVFVKLEVLPKPLYNGYSKEVEFYEEFFGAVNIWAESGPVLTQVAFDEATRAGLAACDALHVAAAASVGAQELVTNEKPGKPIHRATLVPVHSIHLPDQP